MIPDQYWQLARRWLWLIVFCAVAGAATGLWVLPSFVGSTSSFNSSSTLAVSHYVSPTRIITPGEDDETDLAMANYTESLATHAGTPQFIANLQQKLAQQGILLSHQAIKGRLEVSANPTLFRVDIRASAGTSNVTEALVTNAADVLTARVEAEEDLVMLGLIANLEDQQEELVTRLEVLAAEQQAIEDADGDPFLTDLESLVVEEELRELIRRRERLLFYQARGQPLVAVNPLETVETEANALETRDLLLLGTAAGLLVGWGSANLAERVRYAKRSKTTNDRHQAEDGEARAATAGLRMLVDRATEVERRAKALHQSTASASGELPRRGHEHA